MKEKAIKRLWGKALAKRLNETLEQWLWRVAPYYVGVPVIEMTELIEIKPQTYER